MLQINSLKLRHFMCCTSADLKFKDAGIIVLNGENGSGKSSALDAIAICLCEHKRADRYNDFVQKGFNEATIEMDSTLNGEPLFFNIKMHYEKGAALERDILYKGRHYVNSEATPLLQELDLPFYSTIIFSMQGDADVASMSPTARAIFLQKLLQFDFTKQSLSLKNKIEEFESTKTYNNSQIDFIENSLKNKVLRELQILPFSKEEKEEKYALSMKYSNRLNDRSVLYNKKDSLIEIQKDLLNKIAQRDKEYAIYEQWETSNKAFEEAVSTSKKEFEEYEKTFSIEGFDKKHEELLEKFTKEIPALWKQASEDRDKAVQDLAELKSQKTSLQNKDELLKAGKCPHCGQSTDFLKDEHIVEALADIDKKIEKCQETISKCDKDVMEYRHQSHLTQEEILKVVDEKNNKVNMFNSLKEAIDANTKRLEYSKANKPTLSKNTDVYEINLAETNRKLKDINDELSTFSEVELELSKIINDLNSYEAIEERNSWILEENKRIEKETIEDRERIESLKHNNIDLSNSQKDYIEARKIIDNDLPNFLIVKTCGRLEQEMNDFIQVVFPTMQVRLFQNKKGVEFYYTRDEKADATSKKALINTKMASGFEKSLLSIAFKVALCRAYNLSFTVLDEIDAFATDLSSAKIFQSLIESKAFDQLFIITHKPSTREIIQETSDNCIVYHVEKGKFTIEEEE